MKSFDFPPVSLRKILCGGAAVPSHLIKRFRESNVDVHEVYGLTETASLLSFNSGQHKKIGTVGKIAETVEVSFSDEGEVLVKGENVMKGYLLDNFKLDEARDEQGWFHTGDIGELDEDGFLKLTGRKKNAFKNSRGSYIYPEEIEMELMKLSIFDEVIITGDNADSLSVIFKLKDPFLKNNAMENQIRELVKRFNNGKSDELKISRFTLINGKISKDFFSASMKIDRNKIKELINNDKFIPVY